LATLTNTIHSDIKSGVWTCRKSNTATGNRFPDPLDGGQSTTIDVAFVVAFPSSATDDDVTRATANTTKEPRTSVPCDQGVGAGIATST